MSAPSADSDVAKVRGKILAVVALVTVALAVCALYVTEHPITAARLHELRLVSAFDLALLRKQRDSRHAAFADRCFALARKPRIHAALEDGAPDLLYPSAMDAVARLSIRPRFFRFIDGTGSVIAPTNDPEAGTLSPDEEKRVAFPALLQEQQNGYLVRPGDEVLDVIATPIVSTETGEVIAALVAGFTVTANERPQVRLQSGLWLDGKLSFPAIPEQARAILERAVAGTIARRDEAATKGLVVAVGETKQLLFIEQLNPGSLFPPAYEVDTCPIAGLLTRRSESR